MTAAPTAAPAPSRTSPADTLRDLCRDWFAGCDLHARVQLLNELRSVLAEYSPFTAEPVDYVEWVPAETVRANDYNPNTVAPPEMELLRLSIMADGYCVEASTPILCADLIWRPAGELQVGQEIVSFDEVPQDATGRWGRGARRYRTGRVTFNESRESDLLTVETAKGEVRCTPDHPWLARPMRGHSRDRTTRWVEARDLRPGDLVFRMMEPWKVEQTRSAGWLAGFLDGEGTMTVNLTRNGAGAHRLAGYQRPGPTADRMIEEMQSRVEAKVFTLDRTGHPKWKSMAMCRVDRMTEIMRLLGSVRPDRLLEDGGRFWEGRALSAPDCTVEVLSVKPGGVGTIASLATSTRTYIADGYAMHNTQPIVSMQDGDERVVIDGFHRHRVGKEMPDVAARVHGHLPVVRIRHDREDRNDRIASTIRHNRARGKHRVDAMSDIVVELKGRNWPDERIARELGMEADEVLRLCQMSGLAELFSDEEFSASWDVADPDDDFEGMDDTIPDEELRPQEGRIYHTWDKWEAFAAGFFDTTPTNQTLTGPRMKTMYADFLRDIPRFKKAMEGVLTDWPNSAEHNLSNARMNRIAWLGQAAMCWDTGVPAAFCNGFSLLTKEEQETANLAALEYLNKWLAANDRPTLATLKDAERTTQPELY